MTRKNNRGIDRDSPSETAPFELLARIARERKFADTSVFFRRHVYTRGRRAVTRPRARDLCTRVKSRVAASGKRNRSRCPVWKRYRNKRTRGQEIIDWNRPQVLSFSRRARA